MCRTSRSTLQVKTRGTAQRLTLHKEQTASPCGALTAAPGSAPFFARSSPCAVTKGPSSPGSVHAGTHTHTRANTRFSNTSFCKCETVGNTSLAFNFLVFKPAQAPRNCHRFSSLEAIPPSWHISVLLIALYSLPLFLKIWNCTGIGKKEKPLALLPPFLVQL